MGLGASFPVSSAAGGQAAGSSAVCEHQGAAGAQLWASACGRPAALEEVAGLVWQVAQGLPAPPSQSYPLPELLGEGGAGHPFP